MPVPKMPELGQFLRKLGWKKAIAEAPTQPLAWPQLSSAGARREEQQR